jgi:hypothetical protein
VRRTSGYKLARILACHSFPLALDRRQIAIRKTDRAPKLGRFFFFSFGKQAWVGKGKARFARQ